MLYCCISMKAVTLSLASSSSPALAFQLMMASQEVTKELTVFYNAVTHQLPFSVCT